MKGVKTILLTAFFIAASLSSVVAQSGDYQHLVTLVPDMQRKVFANELLLSNDGKYLVVNYGDKPTFIVVYTTEDWKQVANFRLTNWVDFASAYVDVETSQFYVKVSRTSSTYHRLDILKQTQEVVPCEITPRHCPVIELKMSIKSLYTADKKFFININKQNKREVKVYQNSTM